MKLYKHTMKELFSFNRYMVECELGDSLSDIASGLSFNRYMVECELVRTAVIFFMLKVLIDTWWNVNNASAEILPLSSPVLIDTWWNVNEFSKCSIDDSLRVLIDTWWNVNHKAMQSITL